METKIERTDKTKKYLEQRAYRKPKFTIYGEMRDVTLGPSGGTGDSGSETTHGFGFTSGGRNTESFGPP